MGQRRGWNVMLGRAKLSGIGHKSHGNWHKENKSEGAIVSRNSMICRVRMMLVPQLIPRKTIN